MEQFASGSGARLDHVRGGAGWSGSRDAGESGRSAGVVAAVRRDARPPVRPRRGPAANRPTRAVAALAWAWRRRPVTILYLAGFAILIVLVTVR